jgi:hypothetical protein
MEANMADNSRPVKRQIIATKDRLQIEDEQITSIVTKAIRDFNLLSPYQRRRARQITRRWFVGGGANAVRPAGDEEGFETSYDNLDFQGG